MSKVKQFMEKHPIWSFGIVFGVLSVIFNLIWFWFSGMTHVHDIIHVIPVILIYEPIIEMMGGGIPSPLIFLPLAVIIDAMIGLLIGAVSYKINKSSQQQVWVIGISFAVYWIIITLQWLPII